LPIICLLATSSQQASLSARGDGSCLLMLFMRACVHNSHNSDFVSRFDRFDTHNNKNKPACPCHKLLEPAKQVVVNETEEYDASSHELHAFI
jgi:hypothetical protein